MTSGKRADVTATAKEAAPKQWEIRAALRAFARSRETSTRRNPAEDMVEAAWELVATQTDFTVKEVAERAGVALQTFYRHFGTKDELLLAMLEESIGRGVAARVAEAAGLDDPVDRLRYLVIGPIVDQYDEAGVRGLQWRARERQRLSQRYPEAVEAVHEPYRTALHDAIATAKSAGRVDSADPALDANLIQHLVLTMTHAVHGGGLNESPSAVADAVWSLCWRGLAHAEETDRRVTKGANADGHESPASRPPAARRRTAASRRT